MIKKILLFNAHPRALITQLRELVLIDNIEIHLALHNKRFNHKIFLWSYSETVKIHYFNQNELIRFLFDLKKEIGGYTIFQNGEGFLRLILENKNVLEQNDIICDFADLKSYLTVSDKHSFSELCSDYQIKTPQVIAPELSKFSEKFVVKSKKMDLKTGVLKYPLLIENSKSFDKLIKLNIDIEKHFFQEYIHGQSFYYCAHYSTGIKKIDFVQENLKQQPNGKSVIKAKKSFLDKIIVQKIDKIFFDLKWNGVMMVELKKCTKTNEYYAIECNPRFWGPLQLASDNGVSFVKSILNIEQIQNTENKSIGYIWLTGYFQGLLFKIKTKTNFQTFTDNNKKLYYKDLWFRKDTMLFFIFEPFFILIDFFIKLRKN